MSRFESIIEENHQIYSDERKSLINRFSFNMNWISSPLADENYFRGWTMTADRPFLCETIEREFIDDFCLVIEWMILLIWSNFAVTIDQ